MQRVKFETVAVLDSKIFSSLNSEEELDDAMEKYYTLLIMCGWDKVDYENELLIRIDNDW
jgi:hypothetical protein